MSNFTPSDCRALETARFQLSQRPMAPLPLSPTVSAVAPVNLLPREAADLVSSSATTIGVHPEIAATCLLASVFIAARGNFRVQVNDHHVEALTEYFIASAPSGHRKSAILEFFRRVFEDVQNELQARHHKDGIGRERKILSAAVKRAEADLAQKIAQATAEHASLEKAQAELKADFAVVEELRKGLRSGTMLPRLLSDVPTMEALAVLMEQQGGVSAIFEAEGGLWKCRARASSDDILLKGYTGEAFTSETKTQGTVHLAAAVLSICSLVQPNVLDALYDDGSLVEHGLVPRMLPLLTPSWSMFPSRFDTTVRPELASWYEQHIRALLEISCSTDEQGRRTIRTLTMTNDARAELERFTQYWRNFEFGLQADVPDGYKSFLKKLPGHAVRLAGAVHLLKHRDPYNHLIDLDSMACGAAFAGFFNQHAYVAFDQTSRDGITFAPKILSFARRHRLLQFTVREAHRGIGSDNCKAPHVRAGIDVLCRHNYVQGVFTSKGLVYVTHFNIG